MINFDLLLREDWEIYLFKKQNKINLAVGIYSNDLENLLIYHPSVQHHCQVNEDMQNCAHVHCLFQTQEKILGAAIGQFYNLISPKILKESFMTYKYFCSLYCRGPLWLLLYSVHMIKFLGSSALNSSYSHHQSFHLQV